jgi:hypothetical protein
MTNTSLVVWCGVDNKEKEVDSRECVQILCRCTGDDHSRDDSPNAVRLYQETDVASRDMVLPYRQNVQTKPRRAPRHHKSVKPLLAQGLLNKPLTGRSETPIRTVDSQRMREFRSPSVAPQEKARPVANRVPDPRFRR